MTDLNPAAPEQDEEEFHSEYRVFFDALRMLAASAEEQCRAMGNFNVAWELKNDVQAGRYLVGRGYLEPVQEAWIQALCEAINAIPAQTLPAGDEWAANLSAMNHPSWIPLRVLAAHTIRELESFSAKNGRYLGLNDGRGRPCRATR